MIDVAHWSWQGWTVIGLLFSSILLSKRFKIIPRDLIFAIAGLLTAMSGIITSEQIYRSAVNQVMMTLLGIWLLGRAMHQQRVFPFLPRKVFPLLFSAIGFDNAYRNCSELQATLWKKIAVAALFFAAIFSAIAGLPIGTAFFCTALATLGIRAFPIKQTFLEEFPLPILLEFFSAYLFYFALSQSGLNTGLANLIPSLSLYFALPLFFVLAQFITYFMPRSVAFAVLFSIASSHFSGHSGEVLATGIAIALSTALPLFENHLAKVYKLIRSGAKS